MSVSLLSPFIQFSNPFYCKTQSGLSPAVNSVQCQKLRFGLGLVTGTRPCGYKTSEFGKMCFSTPSEILKRFLSEIMRREHINKKSSS